MKIVKYIIFLSIFGSIFIILYRNCDNKGFRRWWICFKMTIFIAGILAGLIPNSTEAIEPYGKNPNPSIEIVKRSLKISGGDQSKTGPGARAKADARARAKTQPGVADAFVPQRNYWPYQKPL